MLIERKEIRVKANLANAKVSAKNERGNLDSGYAVYTQDGRCLVRVRVLATSSGGVYATIRVVNGDIQAYGVGHAGGGGYHMASAALSEAIDDAGIGLNLIEDKSPYLFDGTGAANMRQAIAAISFALTKKHKLIFMAC